MAFNWQTFKTRTLSAIVFVVVMLAGLLYNAWSFLLLISIIHFGCWWEFCKLIEKIHNTSISIYIKLGFILIGYHIVLLFCQHLMIGSYHVQNNFSLPFLIAGCFLLVMGIFQQQSFNVKSFIATAVGLIYISLSLGLMMHMRLSQNFHIMRIDDIQYKSGYYIPILIIASVWINDTMAYIVGSAIGKTPLSPISPKKTIEGTAGGMLLCVLLMVLITKHWFQWPYVLGIAVIVSITGTIGDLLESKIKRMAGVKDSGKMMPGHGGFLDRFDSLLVATIFVWIFLQVYASA